MGRPYFNFAAVLALALLASACSSSSSVSSWLNPQPPPDEPNKFPTNYRQDILLTMPTVLGDPANVRDGGITDPALRPAGREDRYAVCVRTNSRDAERKYTGLKYHIAWFYDGRLNQLVEAKPEQCANAPFKPFPEVEKLCQVKSCA